MIKATNRLAFLAIIGFMLGGCLHAAPAEVPPRLLVKWKKGPTSSDCLRGNAQIGSTVKRNFNALGWQLVELPEGFSATEGIAAYRALDGVAAIEADGA